MDKKKDYSNLNALFVNCTLKKSPQKSHTKGLWEISKKIFEKNKIQCDEVRLVDHDIAFGVYGDMKQH